MKTDQKFVFGKKEGFISRQVGQLLCIHGSTIVPGTVWENLEDLIQLKCVAGGGKGWKEIRLERRVRPIMD